MKLFKVQRLLPKERDPCRGLKRSGAAQFSDSSGSFPGLFFRKGRKKIGPLTPIGKTALSANCSIFRLKSVSHIAVET
jgi:hypothetical protein